MPVVRSEGAEAFEVHGSRFTSFFRSAGGSTELCAWMLRVPPEAPGAPHQPSHEEVLLVLEGELQVELDGERSAVGPHDAVLVPAGSDLRVNGGPDGATAWVTTTSGLEALLSDGTSIRPPWAQ